MGVTKIEWTSYIKEGRVIQGYTFNPWRGCTKVSEGCANCYAETLSHRNPSVLGVWGPSGTRVVAAESAWREPLKWNRAAEKRGERHRVFCASLADVFEDWSGPMSGSNGQSLIRMDDVRDRLFNLIRETPNLDWLLLTKRPERFTAVLDRQMTRRPFIVHDFNAGPRQERWTNWKELGRSYAWMWPNVWLGTSVENQQAADERIPHLLNTSACVRFLSCEPLLGPVNLLADPTGRPTWWLNGILDHPDEPTVDWVIAGAESGPGARPCNLDWVRSLRDQCVAAGVPFFFKQHAVNGRKISLPELDGQQWAQFPEVQP